MTNTRRSDQIVSGEPFKLGKLNSYPAKLDPLCYNGPKRNETESDERSHVGSHHEISSAAGSSY